MNGTGNNVTGNIASASLGASSVAVVATAAAHHSPASHMLKDTRGGKAGDPGYGVQDVGCESGLPILPTARLNLPQLNRIANTLSPPSVQGMDETFCLVWRKVGLGDLSHWCSSEIPGLSSEAVRAQGLLWRL